MELRKQLKDILSKNIKTVKSDAKVDVAVNIMANKKISCVIVMENKKPVGILTERDMIKRVLQPEKDPQRTTVAEVMSSPLVMLPSHADWISAARQMKEKNIRRVAVMENGKLIGIATQTDILNAGMDNVAYLSWRLMGIGISFKDFKKKLKFDVS